MFCPKCAERQANEATQFCSKCGFPTSIVKNLLKNDGLVADENNIVIGRKGIRHGALLMLSSLILFPAFVLLSALFPPNDRLIESSPSTTWFEQIGWAILWTLLLSGVARIAYALIFERQTTATESLIEKIKQIKQIKSNENKNALPPAESVPASDFGKWKTTGDLYEPIFVKRKTSGDLR